MLCLPPRLARARGVLPRQAAAHPTSRPGSGYRRAPAAVSDRLRIARLGVRRSAEQSLEAPRSPEALPLLQGLRRTAGPYAARVRDRAPESTAKPAADGSDAVQAHALARRTPPASFPIAACTPQRSCPHAAAPASAVSARLLRAPLWFPPEAWSTAVAWCLFCASPLPAHRAPNVHLRVLLFKVGALVVLLLAFAQPDLDLDLAAQQVHL